MPNSARRELVCNEPATPPRLALQTRELPRPEPGQVLVQVEATSINPIDIKRAGKAAPSPAGARSVMNSRSGEGPRSIDESVKSGRAFSPCRVRGSASSRGSSRNPMTNALVAIAIADHEILEDRLIDGGARELQRDALEPIDVDQRHRHEAEAMIDTKRDPRRNHWRHWKNALAQRPVRILDCSACTANPNTSSVFSNEIHPRTTSIVSGFEAEMS
jgi:hypothetical protein